MMDDSSSKKIAEFCKRGIELATERCIDRNTDEKERLTYCGEIDAYRAVIFFITGENEVTFEEKDNG